MKMRLTIQRFRTICFLGAIIFLTGCGPSARQAAKILYGVPLGSSRDEVRKAIIEGFHKKYPDDQIDYFPDSPPVLITSQMLEADKKLISDFRKDQAYVRVYPTNLFDKLPPSTLGEGVVVAESSDANGGVDIFYDSQMHYIGFLSYANGSDSSQ
jgi:hypothetical protein